LALANKHRISIAYPWLEPMQPGCMNPVEVDAGCGSLAAGAAGHRPTRNRHSSTLQKAASGGKKKAANSFHQGLNAASCLKVKSQRLYLRLTRHCCHQCSARSFTTSSTSTKLTGGVPASLVLRVEFALGLRHEVSTYSGVRNAAVGSSKHIAFSCSGANKSFCRLWEQSRSLGIVDGAGRSREQPPPVECDSAAKHGPAHLCVIPRSIAIDRYRLVLLSHQRSGYRKCVSSLVPSSLPPLCCSS